MRKVESLTALNLNVELAKTNSRKVNKYIMGKEINSISLKEDKWIMSI